MELPTFFPNPFCDPSFSCVNALRVRVVLSSPREFMNLKIRASTGFSQSEYGIIHHNSEGIYSSESALRCGGGLGAPLRMKVKNWIMSPPCNLASLISSLQFTLALTMTSKSDRKV